MSNGTTPRCTGEHCSKVSAVINEACKERGWGINKSVPVCNPFTGECCMCSCSCLAFNTPVLVSAGQYKNVQDFLIGDPVMAFNPDGTSASTEVGFSNGTSPASVQPEMAYLTYQVDGESRTIVVTLDHTFLRADQKLIRASMLRPGMELVLATGGNTVIDNYEVKGYTGGVWNISTSTEPPTSLDGHLIDTSGVLSGDYTVQLYYLDFVSLARAVDHQEEPEVTTREYAARAGAQGLPSGQASPPSKPLADFLAGANGPTNRLVGDGQGGGVVLHHDHAFVLDVPANVGTQGFLTTAQALEAAEYLRPETQRTASEMSTMIWLVTLFGAFYKDITFVIDAPNNAANAYSLLLGQQKYILIQGGLIRARPLDWQGLALILAYSTSRFDGGEPRGTDGLTCKPRADYSSISTLSSVFYPLYTKMIFDAYNQIKEFFAGLQDTTDNPVGGCHETTLECRMETYAAAMQYLSLPECAGGPKPDLLEVTGAEGSTDGSVAVSFNDFVQVSSAQNPINYAFDPAANVSKAKVDSQDGHKVNLTGDFVSGTEYKVTVSNVQSIIGDALDPEKNSATFTMP